MPAMSPTMTEGNIAGWKVKEGDPFSAGDVLLEIETDKAQMDVEAQDDGIMAKITQLDGSKAVKVGSRIGVLAEQGDDLSTISIPPEDSAPSLSSQRGKDVSAPKNGSSPSPDSSSSRSHASASKTPPGQPTKQTYPLYPSVQHLLHLHGLPLSEADKIPASGPNGRLLKGDVLSYMGSIPPTYASELSSRVSKLGHLDLSKIKSVTPKKADPATSSQGTKTSTSRIETPSSPAAAAAPAPAHRTEITLPISLTAVLALQARLLETLDIHLPLPTFISRAASIANANLPSSRRSSPTTADELFNQVLGLDQILSSKTSTSQGHFVPQIVALPSLTAASSQPRPPSKHDHKAKELDVYDILTGKAGAKRSLGSLGSVVDSTAEKHGVGAGDTSSTKFFSVTAEAGETKRAKTFLERVKAVLEEQPGRLVV
ncbi:MAG: pyridoxine biosynthesis protein [Sclerophora amabilis]|nr:MAG: pyridoxine biosynthesis protein [Sclerophora amabilis]